MSEEKFAPYYSKIAKVLDKMIPVEWTELFMIYYDKEGISSIGMYFRAKDRTLYWCHSIPSDFHVDKEIYDRIKDELSDICEAYKKEFTKETGDEWSFMLFHLMASMEFDVKYYYDMDSEADSSDIMNGIFYENYKIEPKGEFSKKYLHEYLAIYSVKKNPRWPFGCMIREKDERDARCTKMREKGSKLQKWQNSSRKYG